MLSNFLNLFKFYFSDFENYLQEDFIFQKKFFDLFQKYLSHPKKILIGISGGPDSIFLSWLIFKYYKSQNWDFSQIFLVYCNHKVRIGNYLEEKFLSKFFENFNFFSFKATKFPQKTENSFRQRRYKIFEDFSNQKEIDLILLGHNFTDKLETVFLNMMRGFSPQNLNSMEIFSEHYLLQKKVFRPLLIASKQQILSYLENIGLPYFLDPTNFKKTYSKRNLVRKNIFEIAKAANFDSSWGNKFYLSWEKLFNYVQDCQKKEIDFSNQQKYFEKKISQYKSFVEKIEADKSFVKIKFKNFGNMKFFESLKNNFGIEAKNPFVFEFPWLDFSCFKMNNFTLADFISFVKSLGIFKDFGYETWKEIWKICEKNHQGIKVFGDFIIVKSAGCRLLKNKKFSDNISFLDLLKNSSSFKKELKVNEIGLFIDKFFDSTKDFEQNLTKLKKYQIPRFIRVLFDFRVL